MTRNFYTLIFIVTVVVSIIGGGCESNESFLDITKEAQISATSGPFRVIYDANGMTPDTGILPVDSTEYQKGQEAIVLQMQGNPLRLRYNDAAWRFVGWNTKPDGSGTDYLAGEKITVNSNITLFAKWVQFKVGDRGPAGGWVAYDNNTYEKSKDVDDVEFYWRYIEVWTNDVEGNFSWHENTTDLINNFQDRHKPGYGKYNTHLAANSCVGDNYAVKIAANFESHYIRSDTNFEVIYNDWALPTSDEAVNVFQFLKNIGDNNIDIGYKAWCSNEIDGANVAMVYHDSGGIFVKTVPQSGYTGKGNQWRVRPIRYF